MAAPRDARRWPQDDRRPLTAGGRARMVEAARGMRALGLAIDLVLTSPLTRARQTARIVVAALRPRPPIRIDRALAPGGAPADVLAAIRALASVRAVLLVGHEPDLSRLAGALILSSPGALAIEFRKGGLCRIDVEGAPSAGSGRLVLHLKPKVLRLLAPPGR